MKRPTPKMLAKGCSGCIFWPPLACESSGLFTGTESHIGKIIPLHKSKREIFAAEEYARIDPHHTFTLPYLGSCNVSKRALADAKDSDRCHLTKAEPQDLVQLVFAKGGKTLQEILDEGLTQRAFESLFAGLQFLIAGLEKMSRANICHCDIKPDNLLCYEKRLFLIDYGVVKRSYSTFKPNSLMLRIKHWYVPPEATFYTMQDVPFQEIVKNVAEPLITLARNHGVPPEAFFGPVQLEQLRTLADSMRTRRGQTSRIFEARHVSSRHDHQTHGCTDKKLIEESRSTYK